MAKMMLFEGEARAALARGVNTLTRAVGATLGPKGGNAVIDVPIGTPIISRDGVSIAAEIELEDRFENMGAQVAREVSKQTNEIAGDGTTTATVLANALIQKGFKALDKGYAGVDIAAGIDIAVEQVVAALKAAAVPISDNAEAITAVATIAANDRTTGAIVADSLRQVGPAGIVTVELGLTVETTVDVAEGASYERGYISHHMVNDVESMRIIMDDIVILLTDQDIVSEDDVAFLKGLASQANKPLLIIADEYSPESVAAMLRKDDRPPLIAIHPPEYGKWRKAMLEDIAIMSGGRVFTSELGHDFRSATLEDLGNASGLNVASNHTIISGGQGDAKVIQGRIDQIKRQLELNEVLIEEDKYNERLAKLAGGVAVIHAGGATPVEQKRTVQLIEDALNATRAAIEDGVVAGGGTALMQARPALDATSDDLKGGVRKGIKIVKHALSQPLATIARNAGVNPKSVIKQVAAANLGYGYDAREGQIVDMIASGIADPVKVTTEALINAASVANLILTTQTLIADIPDDEDPTAGRARGGGAEKLGLN